MKSLIEILESDASVNATGGIATNPTPIFKTRRFAGKDDHVIPEEHYLKLRNGREKYALWDTHLPEPTIQAAVRKSLYRDGTCLITNAKSGLSVMLKHDIQRRQQAANNDDATLMAYESTEGDFTFFDESQVAPLLQQIGDLADFDEEDDPDYIQAYGYYSEELGKNDDESDAFAQIVSCFFDNVYSSEDITDTIDSMFNAAVTEVKAGSELLGLPEIPIGLIHDAKKYIEDNYDVITGQPTDDGEVEYDFPDDSDGSIEVLFTEGAVLAELPSVQPTDTSKDDVEGWAIINLKANKVIDRPKKGETMEHKSNWLREYHGAAGVGAGMEVAWVNTKTGLVSKVKAETPKGKK